MFSPKRLLPKWLSPSKLAKILLTLFTLLLTTYYLLPTTFADEIEDLQREIDVLNKAREMSVAATKPLEGQLDSLERQLQQIKVKLQTLTYTIAQKEKDLKVREDKLVLQQALLSSRVRSYYIHSYLDSPLLMLLSQSGSGDVFRELAYRQAATREDQRVISFVTEEMMNLLTQKDKLEKDKISLAALQVEVDKNADFLDGEISKAKKYQADLSTKIADLSAKQQAILAARSGQFTASIGDSELADDYNASIKGFREAAPAGSFAVFSFGAHTHRKGMSQYGARGRANAGQTYDQILKAYYSFDNYEDRSGIAIKVNNGNCVDCGSVIWTGSLEDYVKRIYEVPANWPEATLQAQSIAARTYALAVTNNGASSICATEGCQVFKTQPKGGNWENAVNSTTGKVMISGGQSIKAYFASTHGGFASPIGWDTTDGSGGSNFVDKSYDKAGGSPWVYKAWYRQGYTAGGDSCGRSNPWLSGEELADIINAAKYRDDRVTPVTTSCWGGNPYSHAELREKANGPSTVTSVTVVQGNGATNELIFQTDKGEIKLSGSDFKTAFNIRAPGRLSIPQSGFAFFNIEKK